jgi:hypothetical protein
MADTAAVQTVVNAWLGPDRVLDAEAGAGSEGVGVLAAGAGAPPTLLTARGC